MQIKVETAQDKSSRVNSENDCWGYFFLICCSAQTANGGSNMSFRAPGGVWSRRNMYTHAAGFYWTSKGPQPAQKANSLDSRTRQPSCSISAAFQLGRNQSDPMANQIYETQKKWKAPARRLPSHWAKLCSDPSFSTLKCVDRTRAWTFY